ncbi:hypothetical protein APA_1651 [Pseudanabaena sp. lw0831]|nr:hypothetical protein APA_1651 [Pseudanabaena sp. lw0831]
MQTQNHKFAPPQGRKFMILGLSSCAPAGRNLMGWGNLFCTST